MLATESGDFLTLEDGSTLILLENEHVLSVPLSVARAANVTPSLLSGAVSRSPLTGTTYAFAVPPPVGPGAVSLDSLVASLMATAISPLSSRTQHIVGNAASNAVALPPSRQSVASIVPFLGQSHAVASSPSLSALATLLPGLSRAHALVISPLPSPGAVDVSVSDYAGSHAAAVDLSLASLATLPASISLSHAVSVLPPVASGPITVEASDSGLSHAHAADPGLSVIAVLSADIATSAAMVFDLIAHRRQFASVAKSYAFSVDPSVAFSVVLLPPVVLEAHAKGLSPDRISTATLLADVALSHAMSFTPSITGLHVLTPEIATAMLSAISPIVVSGSVSVVPGISSADGLIVNPDLYALASLAPGIATLHAAHVEADLIALARLQALTARALATGTDLTTSAGPITATASIAEAIASVLGVHFSSAHTLNVADVATALALAHGIDSRVSERILKLWTALSRPTIWTPRPTQTTWILEPKTTLFRVVENNAMSTQILTKQPSESMIFGFDFSALLQGDTITQVVSLEADIDGLTITDIGISSDGTKAQARISGGTAGQMYKLTAIVETNNGDTLEADGRLQVRD